MDTNEKYDVIFHTMLNGTVEDWERLAKQFPDFPDGLDSDETYEDNYGELQYLGDNWLTHAILCASLECVRWIISKGVNMNFKSPGGYFPLHSCIDRDLPNKYEIMQLLIDNGADVNIGTELETMGFNGWSPLHMAAARNDLEAIKILLDNGADTTLKTIIDNYCTAEEEALLLGKPEAAELIRTYKPKAK